MVQKNKCFAIDYSGSTWNDDFYHSNVLSILQSKYKYDDEIIIWDSNSSYISKENYMQINREKDGRGGTYPQCIFQTIFSKHEKVHYSEFILISDGDIMNSDVEKLDKVIQENIGKFKTDYTEVYLLGWDANLSVSCPFSRFNASKTIVKRPYTNDEIIEVSNNDLKTIDEIDSINTLEDFNLKYPSLEKAFTARLLGTDGDKELRKSVLLMQKRINHDNAERFGNRNSKIDHLVIQEKNYNEAKKEAIKCFTSILNGDFQSKINLLIRMSDGELKQTFDIDQLQTFRQFTSPDTEKNEVVEIQNLNIESSVKDAQWECPISMDNEVDPMILITVDEEKFCGNYQPILIGFDKMTTERIINCPLNAIYIDEFVRKFKSFIDHPMSLYNYRTSLLTSNSITHSPITRKKIIGAIPLGENEEHVKAANWTLMKIITGGKSLGDINLWFFNLYLMIKKGFLPYLEDIEPYVKAQVIYRFSNYKTSISLSGLSNLPQTKVFYPTAAWTCLISPFLIPQIPNHLNLFYVHLGHYKELIEILNLFSLELPKEFDRMANRVRTVSHLLIFFKKNPKLLPMYINGLKHASILINVDLYSPLSSGGLCGDVIIPIDGEINKDERLKCIQQLSDICYDTVKNGKVTINELVWLLNFIDVQKNLTDINALSLLGNQKEKRNQFIPIITEFWKEWDDNVEKFNNIKISENTCRPFYYVKPNVTWLDELGKIVNVNEPILSLDKHFGGFVESYHQYPTKEEYILYLYRKVCLGGLISETLPRNIIRFTDQVFERYKDIMDKLTPNEFSKRYFENTYINVRIKNEY